MTVRLPFTLVTRFESRKGCFFFRLDGERSRAIPKKWLGPSLSAFAAEERASESAKLRCRHYL
jgi:hypothetical protein